MVALHKKETIMGSWSLHNKNHNFSVFTCTFIRACFYKDGILLVISTVSLVELEKVYMLIII